MQSIELITNCLAFANQFNNISPVLPCAKRWLFLLLRCAICHLAYFGLIEFFFSLNKSAAVKRGIYLGYGSGETLKFWSNSHDSASTASRWEEIMLLSLVYFRPWKEAFPILPQ